MTRLADADWFERWISSASPEALIVAYADKRAGQHVESMAERFASWERRYPLAERAGPARDGWSAETLASVQRRAEEIERRVCRLADIRPVDVARLAWTGRAFAGARRLGVAAADAATGGS